MISEIDRLALTSRHAGLGLQYRRTLFSISIILTTSITIKTIPARDIPAVQRILFDAFAMMSGTFYPSEIIEQLHNHYSVERLERLLTGSRSIALGAYIDGVLVGCTWGSMSTFDGIFSVEWAVVRLDMIGKGVFSQLLTALEQPLKLKGTFKMFLYASIKNVPAIERYIKLGYSIEGVHRNHFFGWDFVSMGKVLTHKHWNGEIANQPDFSALG
jgi:GNAT superfamily N-acetyltransferase